MTDGFHVTLDGIHLQTAEEAIPPDVDWVFIRRGLSAWWGKDNDKTPVMDHPVADGVTSGAIRRGERILPLVGWVRAARDDNPGAVFAGLDRLTAIDHALLVVDEPTRGLTREADVRVVQVVPTQLSPWLVQVAVTLAADDPLRYGSDVQELVGFTNTFRNRGNRSARPLLETVGPTSMRIAHAGGEFVANIPTGKHTIDCRNGRVWGPDGRTSLWRTTGPFPVVRSGGDQWEVLSLTGGAVTVRRFEAWG